MAVMALPVSASCGYCTLPLGARPHRLPARAAAQTDPLVFCCQGCAWAFQILGGRGEGSEATLAGARLLAAFAAGMVVMIAGWARYLDAFLTGSRAPAPFVAQPGDLEVFFSRVYEPMAAGAVFLLLGWPIIRATLGGLRDGALGLNVLVTLGVLAAYVASLVSTLRGAGHTYYDTASVILLLVTAGRYVESAARARAAKALRRLLAGPSEAEVVRDGIQQTVPADAVRLDDVVLVRPGATFPVDGVVLEGVGGVDEAALTGESRPVLKEPGETVIAGAVSYDGAFRLQPTRVGAATFLRRLEALVEQARLSRAPIERQADRLARLLAVAAALVGAGTLLYWGLWQGDPAAGLLYALAVLLIACPCALGIATPLALWVGLAEAARRGILVREAAALETLGHARHVFTDKTGTLTTGRPGLRRIDLPTNGEMTSATALGLAAALGHRSEHPASRALVQAAPAADPAAVDEFRTWPGLGVNGQIRQTGERVALGSGQLMARLGFACPPELVHGEPGETTVYLGSGERVVAAFRLVDAVRPSAAEAVPALRRLGVRLTILTGDSQAAAGTLAQELGLAEVQAGLLPGDKAALLGRAERRRGAIVMLGDGINDAPALAVADVGIAMGGGTDLARGSAPVVLAGDDLRQVAWLLGMARRVSSTVRANLFWAAFYNVLGIGLAAAGLLQPVLAAFAMVASSLLVLGNTLRLQRQEGA